MEKRVIITGAAGFIGRNLAVRLAKTGYNIYAVVRPGSENAARLPALPNINIIELDMNNYDKLASAINKPCEALFAFAWNGVRGSDRQNSALQQANCKNSLSAINSAISLGCKTIILAGSQAEYGFQNKVITEKTSCQPFDEYGRFKLRLFHQTAEICIKNNVHFKEPRFFSIYGKGDYSGSLIMSAVRSMLRNIDCKLTECTQLWDYLYIDDAVEAVISIFNAGCPDGAYNVAYGSSRPLKYFVEELHRLTGSGSRLLYGSIPFGPSGSIGIQASIDKLKNQTGFAPRIDFTEGAKRVIEDIRNECKGS